MQVHDAFTYVFNVVLLKMVKSNYLAGEEVTGV